MPMPRKIKCLKTGRVFPTIADAAKHLEITYPALINKLRGRRPNNTSMRYIEDCNDYMDGKTYHEMEMEFILGALKHYGGNTKVTAEKLGIGRATIYNKLRKLKTKELL